MTRALKTLAMTLTAVAAFSQPCLANSLSYTGWWADGSTTIGFSVTTPGTIDFQTAAGSVDPMISLFDAAGNHIITADDESNPVSTMQAHLTRNLAAGDYFVLLGEFEVLLGHILFDGTATHVFTDGFNTGSYFVGGTATLASTQAAALAQVTNYPGYAIYGALPYDLTISSQDGVIDGDPTAAPVPEPASLVLLGTGLVAAGARGRRRTRA